MAAYYFKMRLAVGCDHFAAANAGTPKWQQNGVPALRLSHPTKHSDSISALPWISWHQQMQSGRTLDHAPPDYCSPRRFLLHNLLRIAVSSGASGPRFGWRQAAPKRMQAAAVHGSVCVFGRTTHNVHASLACQMRNKLNRPWSHSDHPEIHRKNS